MSIKRVYISTNTSIGISIEDSIDASCSIGLLLSAECFGCFESADPRRQFVMLSLIIGIESIEVCARCVGLLNIVVKLFLNDGLSLFEVSDAAA